MKNEMVKTGMKIGATLGTLVFFILGLMPGFYFGGYGAIALLSKLSGGAVEATILSRVIVLCGVLVGVFSMLTVSLVVGGLLGSALGYLVSLPMSKTLAKQSN